VWATDIDVLPADRVVERREDYWVVRSPSNPTHYWGTLLLFDAPPGEGDGARLERIWQAEFGHLGAVRHRTFSWDRGDGALGQAHEEFVARGYEARTLVGLVATSDHLRSHPRENTDVVVRPLDPRPGADEAAWAQVLSLDVAVRDKRVDEATYRSFLHARTNDLRTLLGNRNGGWYVACTPERGEVVASCGIVVSDGLARYQRVMTAPSYQGRGVASRLVVEAARHVGAHCHPASFIIVTDATSHALGLYESLGFERAESVAAVWRSPD
jgi:ribosomal protein S18 acetylase RimI-like enzyme